MSDYNEDFKTYSPEGHSDPLLPPMHPGEKFSTYGKKTLVIVAETGNVILHASNYALVNTIGADLFVVDVLGLPDIPGLSDISLGTLFNLLLGLAAVATPVFLFSQLLERHEEIFADAKSFFSKGLNLIVTIMLALLYLMVVATEFATLYMRIQEETAPSPIPDFGGNEASFWPMLIMSIALIMTNAAMGLATAHVLRSTKRVLKKGVKL